VGAYALTASPGQDARRGVGAYAIRPYDNLRALCSLSRVRATMVMVSIVGLALKDHGRARTLKGLRAGDAGGLAAHRPALLTLQGPCPAMVL